MAMPGYQHPSELPPPAGPPMSQRPPDESMGMTPPGHAESPQHGAPHGQVPNYPRAPQYADRYLQPPTFPGVLQYAHPSGQVPGYAEASQYATPYAAYTPPAWKRTWGTTMGRWGIAVGVALVTSFFLGMVGGIGEATPEASGQVAGGLAVGTWMYVLLIPWWLDHIVARLGKAGAWAIHGGVSLLLALLNFAYLSLIERTASPGFNVGVGPWMVLVMWAVAYGLCLLFADMLPKSYRPKSYRPVSA